ncbi:tRNA (guanine-N(7)-)-methyltransferase [Talaromyces atroroseus]|uniref:tRNA (guanine-N(7)-)-methyltransferase n=1 Tax=Talaromyces atroroseus TaxID=1441469 RepID=A0A225B2B6_TALAT|nr:tRNA (guanine-N(7)-)-methyltransferase [Talaromyces atroroseus]OKL59987.1 tRNA (guanine-N(7)-)-methyltransferase [Talaromyces atroroseus]
MPEQKKKKTTRGEFRKAQKLGLESGDANGVKLPQKKFYRQRAHANPFADYALEHPLTPAHMSWESNYPAFVDPNPANTTLAGTRKLLKDVEVADIGCGFGGLLIGLAPVLPDTLMVGLEIRSQVTEYVKARVVALRNQQEKLRAASSSSTSPSETTKPDTNDSATTNEQDLPEDAPALPDSTQQATTLVPGGYQNISALRANTMKFLPRFFRRHQLSKIFICFPDPHFKARKHKARIISSSLNAEYAFVLKPGGFLYTITDVEEYHYWILRHFGVQNTRTTTTTKEDNNSQDENATPASADDVEDEEDDEDANSGVARVRELFERVSDEELAKDECVRVMREETEEGKKVARNNGPKFVAVFRRLPDPEW